MPIAYLASRYPAISHTFIQREIAALRRRGLDIHSFSVRATVAADLLSAVDLEEAAATVSILPVRPARVAVDHARALARAPRRYLAALRLSLGLSTGGFRGALWRLFCFAEAIMLQERLRERGLRHLHVHFANVAADLAMLVVRYADRDHDRWTWSFTMHGPTEFSAVSAHRLREKVVSADLVICVSEFARSQLMRSSAAEHWDKLRVVHCGVDPKCFSADVKSGEPGSASVLFVGRLVPDKGAEIAIRAVHAAREAGCDLRLTVVGDGPERMRLEGVAAALSLEESVSFAGAVAQDRIRDLLAECDIFCLPSFAEGVPIVLMEAMAMRRPVVTTSIMGIPELVHDGVSGLLVRPSRLDDLASALMRLAAEPSLRHRLAESGRQRVVAEFDISHSAALLEDHFTGLRPDVVADGREAARREPSAATQPSGV